MITAGEYRRRRNNPTIGEKLEDTFGPNPCNTLKLTHAETGEQIGLTCNRKRCRDCGPRKQMTLQLQLELLGKHAYIARTDNRAEIDQAIEAAKKRKQRNGEDFLYTIVGDDSLGYLIISNVKLHQDQRYMILAEWFRRILNLYHDAAQRIRRSRAFGVMSLIATRRPIANRDIPSPWHRRTVDSVLVEDVSHLDWTELMFQLGDRDELTTAYPPPSPPTDDLPIPFGV
jgi:hypothetical protein